MHKPTQKDLEWAAVSAAFAAGFFNCYTPTPYDIRQKVATGPDAAQKVADMRRGYWTALPISVLAGGLIALATESPLPLLAALGTDAVMLASYEHHVPAEHRLLRPANTPPRLT